VAQPFGGRLVGEGLEVGKQGPGPMWSGQPPQSVGDLCWIGPPHGVVPAPQAGHHLLFLEAPEPTIDPVRQFVVQARLDQEVLGHGGIVRRSLGCPARSRSTILTT
jgi:hypothetical protein